MKKYSSIYFVENKSSVMKKERQLDEEFIKYEGLLNRLFKILKDDCITV